MPSSLKSLHERLFALPTIEASKVSDGFIVWQNDNMIFAGIVVVPTKILRLNISQYRDLLDATSIQIAPDTLVRCVQATDIEMLKQLRKQLAKELDDNRREVHRKLAMENDR